MVRSENHLARAIRVGFPIYSYLAQSVERCMLAADACAIHVVTYFKVFNEPLNQKL